MPSQRRGFTLLELIITVGVIALLASLIIVTLGKVRGSARRALSANALRQMAMGYTGYSADNDGQLMPGYPDAPMLRQLGISPKLASGQFLDPELAPGASGTPLDPNDASAYVWRLAPYVDDTWETMMVDYGSKDMIARLSAEFSGAERQPCAGSTAGVYGPGTALAAGCNDLGISRVPAYGLNSIHLGGDNVHGGNVVVDRNPWDNPGAKIAATRQSEVRNPARIIVFAPSAFHDQAAGFPSPPVANLVFGSPELRPPTIVIDGVEYPQWKITSNAVEILDPAAFSAGGGVPTVRAGKDELPVAHLDGSVTTESIVGISLEPKAWSPFAVGFP